MPFERVYHGLLAIEIPTIYQILLTLAETFAKAISGRYFSREVAGLIVKTLKGICGFKVRRKRGILRSFRNLEALRRNYVPRNLFEPCSTELRKKEVGAHRSRVKA